MPAFHQIGHDSENLLTAEGLDRFAGAILSPLNYDPIEIETQIAKMGERKGFVTVLDPHLYRPQSERMNLPNWDYYPKDVETSDFGEEWWAGVIDKLAETAIKLAPTLVASPAMVPKTFPDEFFSELVQNETALKVCCVVKQ